jgi:hypothetical protein
VRDYKWADATPGNFIALKHGARSRRIYEPAAADLAAGLRIGPTSRTTPTP